MVTGSGHRSHRTGGGQEGHDHHRAKDVTNAAALATKGSKEIDPSPDDPLLPGAVRKTYEVGPIEVKPGQNNISYQGGQVPKPEESGWIVRMAPNIRREDGTVPPVDVIHLHHGVWLNGSPKDVTRPRLPERFFAAGEEKTIYLPRRVRLPVQEDRQVDHQLHAPQPAGEARRGVDHLHDRLHPGHRSAAADIKAATPLWMDVAERQTYPVFDVIKGRATTAATRTPTTRSSPTSTTRRTTASRCRPTAPCSRPAATCTLVGSTPTCTSTAPARRGRSEVTTQEGVTTPPTSSRRWRTTTSPRARCRGTSPCPSPRGTTACAQEGRRPRDHGHLRQRAGLLVRVDGHHGVVVRPTATGGDDPFATTVNVTGILTHGHLAENDNHGGAPTRRLRRPHRPALRAGPRGRADRELRLRPRRHVGGRHRPDPEGRRHAPFDNSIDAPLENGIWHTITVVQGAV